MANDDKEAEFAFDLFSDIAPLLALFGDQFARQFASESLTWVDHLIFAMVPLGILTAITGAIRVQGPRIAKSFIGRGRENRALAEIELMSSTSKEVCELFNGKSIIRVMGKPRLAQLLVFPNEYRELKKRYDEEDDKMPPNVKAPNKLTSDRSCGIHSLKTAVSTKDPVAPLMKCVEYHSYSYTVIIGFINRVRRCFALSPVLIEKVSPTNLEWLGPPNLQLGLSSDQYAQTFIKKGHEVFLAAAAAVLLQIGLVVIATVTVYHDWTRNAILVEPENYGYPCYVLGTVSLCIGIGICSRAVERNTTEFAWRVLSPEERKPEKQFPKGRPLPKFKPEEDNAPRLMWLQKSQEVSDQAFDGYAILAGPKYHVITSSRLEDTERHFVKEDSTESPKDQPYCMTPPVGRAKAPLEAQKSGTHDPQNDPKWKILTVCAVAAAGFGFVAQFMGLRGLAYPCSIAQLVAILVMALIRASIRRKLGRVPTYGLAFARYEIDYLATRLVYSQDFRYCRAGIDAELTHLNKQEANRVLTWRVKTAEMAKDTEDLAFRFQKPQDIAHQRLSKYGIRAAPTSDPSCQQLIRIRERLGDLCEWRSMALESALSLASSVEAFMDMFFPNTSSEASTLRVGKRIDYLDWAVETIGIPVTKQRDDFVTIPIRRADVNGEPKGRWQADIGAIEAVLSLWMATTEAQTEAAKNEAKANGASTSGASQRSNWRRANTGNDLRYKFCRILGDDYEGRTLKRDLSWWVDELIASQSDNCEGTEGKQLAVFQSDGKSPKNQKIQGTAAPWKCSRARTGVELIIGFNGRQEQFDKRCKSPESQARELAISDTGVLSTILAQHLFTSFMWTVVEHLPEDCLRKGFADSEQEVEIDNRHTFDPLEFRETWYRPTLRHRDLTKLVRAIENNGLGKYMDIMLCMIPALSSKDLLPNQVILKLIPPMRHEQGWAATARSYSRLLDTSIQTSPAEMFCYSVVVEAMDFLSFACQPYDRFVEPQAELKYELEKLIHQLISPRFKHLLTQLAPLYAIQQRQTQFQQIFNQHGTQMNANAPAHDGVTSALLDTEEKADDQLEIFGNPQNALDWELCSTKLGLTRRFKDIYTVLELESATPSKEISSSLRDTIKQPLSLVPQALKDARSPDIFGWTPLHYAALLEDWEFQRWIFKPFQDEKRLRLHHLHDNMERTPIHVAATAGNRWALRSILLCLGEEEKKNALDAIGLDQTTPLHLATRMGLLDRIREILDGGSRHTLTHRDLWGREAIHLAASYGHDEIATLLLQEGAQPHSVDEIGMSPLRYLLKGDVDLKRVRPSDGLAAIGDSQVDTSDFVIREDVPDQDQASITESTAEEQVLTDKKRKIFVEFALKKIDFHDRAGQTFLHHAVQSADTETVRLLVKKGYSLNRHDLQGKSALHLAVLAGRRDMALLLLNGVEGFVAEPSAEDKQKETALMIAARAGHLELVKRLVLREYSDDTGIVLSGDGSESSWLLSGGGKGCDPLARNLEGRTALQIALSRNRDGNDVAQYLLRMHPLQRWPKDTEGESLLVTACRFNASIECIRAIIEQWPKHINDADPNFGQTSLSWACEKTNEEHVRELLAHDDIDVNKQAINWRNYTPLHIAASEGNSHIVQLLLDSPNIDVDRKDEAGDTPLDAGIRERHPEIVRTFLMHSKIHFDVRLEYLKRLCVHSYEDMHCILPVVFGGLPKEEMLKEAQILVELTEDLRDVQPYNTITRQALADPDAREKLSRPMHAAARLGDLDIMKDHKNHVHLADLDGDGWTCIEYANTYREEDLGPDFEKLVQQSRPLKDYLPSRTIPALLDLGDPGSEIQVTPCGVPNHGDCGFYAIEMTGRSANKLVENLDSPVMNIRTTKCVPPRTSSRTKFYYEAKIWEDSAFKGFGVGFCDKKYGRDLLPGWYDISFGYHSDDGSLYVNFGEKGQNPTSDFGLQGQYGIGDTVGVGLNLETGEGFVTHNGIKKDVGDAFKDSRFNGRKMYPCIGLEFRDVKEGGEGIRFELNLGVSPDHPFMYKGTCR